MNVIVIANACLLAALALTGCAAPRPPIDENSEPIVNLAGRSPELFAVELKACQDAADRMATYKPPAGVTVVGVSTDRSRNSMIRSCLRNYKYRIVN